MKERYKVVTIQIKVVDPVYKRLKRKRGNRTWSDFLLEVSED